MNSSQHFPPCYHHNAEQHDIHEDLQNLPFNEIISKLSKYSLRPNLTHLVFCHYSSLALEICARWESAPVYDSLCAFARVLPVLPNLEELSARSLSSRLTDKDILSGIDLVHSSNEIIRERLLAAFRLLNFDNSTYAKLIRPAKLQAFLHHGDRAICYLAIRVLCLYLHASDAASAEMIDRYLGTQPIRGPYEGSEIDYLFFTIWERDRHEVMYNRLKHSQSQGNTLRIYDSDDQASSRYQYSSSVTSIHGTLLLRREANVSGSSTPTQPVSTPTTIENLQKLSKALVESQPILLQGLPGSGKSFLLQYVAQILGHGHSMVKMHLNSQSDAKMLIGLYTAGQKPGSFQWQAGPLTRAASEGRWVLIEDIDRAPAEIMSVLLPLIERREILIPGRGEKIRAAPGFRLIATVRTHLNNLGDEDTARGRMLGDRFWHRVPIQPLGRQELQDVISQKYPLLGSRADSMISAYEKLQSIASMNRSKPAFARARPPTIRELLKWCQRATMTLKKSGVKTDRQGISETAVDNIFLDGVDCFAESLEDEDGRQRFIDALAETMHIDIQRRGHILNERSITMDVTSSNTDVLTVGRASVQKPTRNRRYLSLTTSPSILFARNRPGLRLLEQITVATSVREPILLVGETGIGKTHTVQFLAQCVGRKLHSLNLSQQSEVADLLGGFKPVNARSLAIPLKDEFDELFRDTFAQNSHEDYLKVLNKSVERGQWKRAIKLWKGALNKFEEALAEQSTSGGSTPVDDQGRKRRKVAHRSIESQRSRWHSFAVKLEALEHHASESSSSFAFAFLEGKLVKAVREGDWVLLDEINLATSDTLECLAGLLETGLSAQPSILNTESGNLELIEAHPDFRIFAAMNPSTDIAKRDLPMGIRSRFTEIYVRSPDRDFRALQSIANICLHEDMPHASSNDKVIQQVCSLYLLLQKMALENSLIDGSGQRPQYSLRTFARALRHAKDVGLFCSLPRALYEGFCMCFVTCLGSESAVKVEEIVKVHLFKDKRAAKGELRQKFRPGTTNNNLMELSYQIVSLEKAGKPAVERSWVQKGPQNTADDDTYIITPFISRNLQNLMRSIFARRYPILIQGPTSAGKTSIVEYLARRTGHKFVRVNNHEHTDLQEYLGSYVSAPDGRLVFQDGVLVQALRNGHWIVLDELNLAPTDVLEALNRLLDDNRELLVPETQEVVTPHPDFMLFATQNPPGLYGGRKVLSQAFRNRFLEIHFDEIPVSELNVILSKRSELPESWCSRIVDTHTELSRRRQSNRVFEHDSFATLRDLFRWAFRGGENVEELAANGFLLLAEKARTREDREIVREVITKIFSRKGVKINIDEALLYSREKCAAPGDNVGSITSAVVWSPAMRRLFVLVSQAILHNEAVLLVGATGSGKTTICQIIAEVFGKSLKVINAHQNTETGDLIGAQRPVRNRSVIEDELSTDLSSILLNAHDPSQIKGAPLETLLAMFDELPESNLQSLPVELLTRTAATRARYKALFEWKDGAVVQAMKEGQYFLLDEISLADDSVLERLNSVLDPSRTVTLAEKGTSDSVVTAVPGFQFFATMNPGGDFGKKELSPALRNRFTEIWVPSVTENDDIEPIISANLPSSLQTAASLFVDFARWFGEDFCSFNISTISLRDLLAWARFIRTQDMDEPSSIVHGAAMVYIDTLGANPAALVAVTAANDLERQRDACLDKLSTLFGFNAHKIYRAPINLDAKQLSIEIGLFTLQRLDVESHVDNFNFEAPTTRLNTMRVARALQLTKPILLEGNPGVGKTSLITSLASLVGVHLTRINLSEQTDLIDLFGSDAPVEGADAGVFMWKDAPFLTAMKRGTWVLLDEMNLASQSILEGLNACFDHRGEVYIAELDQTFPRHPDFRLFAAQNPHSQGGGRKGLPSSFVNRFTVVYTDILSHADMEIISTKSFPYIAYDQVQSVLSLTSDLEDRVCKRREFGMKGSPWEFNLRDVFRWLKLRSSRSNLLPAGSVQDYADVIFRARFRSFEDLDKVDALFMKNFLKEHIQSVSYTNIRRRALQVGIATLKRSSTTSSPQARPLIDSRQQLPLIQSLMLSIDQNWPVLLVGESAAGKTTLLELLASITGMSIQTFSLSPDIDSNDLIGGFEQADVWKNVAEFNADLLATIREQAVAMLSEKQLEDLDDDAIVGSLRLVDLLERGINDDPTMNQVCEVLNELHHTYVAPAIGKYYNDCNTLRHSLLKTSSVKFEWSDGILIRAMRKGQWLVLDNANLCSPSVLDRLNSLLEPEGRLIINEQCDRDGNARVITPHPSFRIFLTMDPANGEISRAMRNRTVELFVSRPSPSSMNTAFSNVTFPAVEASMSRYEKLLKIVGHAWAPNVRGRALQYGLGQLSEDDFPLLEKFILDGAGRTFSTDDELMNALADITKVESVFRPLRDLIRSTLGTISKSQDSDEEFETTQPLLPIINEPSWIYMCNTGHFDLSWASEIHEILCDIVGMRRRLAQTSSQAADSTKASRLHRSLMADRIPGGLRESTKDLAPFLEAVCHSLFGWVEQTMASFTVESPHDIEHQVMDRKLRRQTVSSVTQYTISFWWALFDNASSESFEEAMFNALVEQGWKSLLKYKDFIDAGAWSTMSRSFDKIRVSPDMKTGHSMEPLWRIFRPVNIGSWDRLQQVKQVEQLAEQFDRLVWRIDAPIEQLASLGERFKKVVALARSAPISVEDLTEHCKILLDGLFPNQNESLRQPFFSTVFEGICQCFDLQILDKDTHQSNLELTSLNEVTLLANRSCIIDSTSLNGGNASDLLQSLSHYTGFLNPDCGPIALKGTLPVEILHKLYNSDNVTLGRVDMLRSELNLLATVVARDTNVLDTEKLCSLHQLTSKLFLNILRAHEDFISPHQITLLESHLIGDTKIVNSSFTNEIPPALNPASTLLHAMLEEYLQISPNLAITSANHQSVQERLSSLGDLMIGLAKGFLTLYLPDKPFDPSFRQVAEHDLHYKQLQALHTKMEAVVQVGNLLLGKPQELRCKGIQANIEALGEAPMKEKIARPPSSRLQSLQREFTHALALVDRINPTNKEFKSNVTALCKDIDQLMLRLNNQFFGYEDLTSPAIGFLQVLKIGVLASYHADISTQFPDRVLKQITSNIPYLSDSVDLLAFKRIRVESSISSRLQDSVQELNLQLARLHAAVHYDIPEYTVIGFNESLEYFWRKWKAQLSSDQKKADIAASSYHYRDDEDEESDLEKELKTFFGYESHEDTTSAYQEEQDPSIFSPATIAKMHISTFTSKRAAESCFQELLYSVGSTIGSVVPDDFAFLHETKFEHLLPSIMLHLVKKLADLDINAPSPETFNVYSDSNPTQAQKLKDIVKHTKHRFQELLEAWPEQAPIRDCLAICDELLSFSSSEPVIRLLTKLEKLHSSVAQWQSVASRDYSASSIYDQITALVISWRQLELRSWQGLLDREHEATQDQALSWWFVAYENVYQLPLKLMSANENVNDHVLQLLITLESFLRGSSLGQFNQRLLIIKSLLAHLCYGTSAPSMQSVKSAISNCIAYFDRFTSEVLDHIVTERKKLNQEVKNITQLASWKDTNSEALKQSAQVSHRQLFKVIRKFREVLKQPVPWEQFQTSRSSNLFDITVRRTAETHSINESLKMAEMSRPHCHMSWSSRPKRFQNVETTVKAMQDRLSLSKLDIAVSDELRLIVESLSVQVDHLRKSTPQTLTNDNMALAKHVTTRKRKLFLDTLKTLRRMGLKSNLASTILETQESLVKVLVKLPNLSQNNIGIVQESDSTLMTVVDAMSKVRVASRDHHDDLNSSEVLRSVGYLESLLNMVIEQRRCCGEFLQAGQDLSTLLRQLRALWKEERAGVLAFSSNNSQRYAKLEATLTWLPAFIKMTIQSLKDQSLLGGLDSAQMRERLEYYHSKFLELKGQLLSAKVPGVLWITSTYNSTVTIAQTTLREFVSDIESMAMTNPGSRALVLKCLNAIALDDFSQENEIAEDSLLERSAELENTLLEKVDVVLGAAQDVETAISQGNVSTDNPQWLSKAEQSFRTILYSFRTRKVLSAFIFLRDALSVLDSANTRDVNHVAAIFTAVMPILEQYSASFEDYLVRYLELYNTKTIALKQLSTHFVSLVTSGFCKPAEASEDSSQPAEKLESGTGLGDGDGAEDISKDIGDDEDLSELAQQENESGERQEMDKADDAIDMQDQLSGGAGENPTGKDEETASEDSTSQSVSDADGDDANGEEDFEGKGSENDEGEKQVNDAVGEVDDLDPSAVDEKAWDEPQTDESKERDSREQKGSKEGKDQRADSTSEPDKNGEENGHDDSEIDESDENDIPEQQMDQNAPLDSHVKDEEVLELPDDFQLDEDKESDVSKTDNDVDMSDLSDSENHEHEDPSTDAASQAPDQQAEETDDTDMDNEDQEAEKENTMNEELEEKDLTTLDNKGENGDEENAPEEEGGDGLTSHRKEQEDSERNPDVDQEMGVGPQQPTEDQMNSQSQARREAGNQSQSTTQEMAMINSKQNEGSRQDSETKSRDEDTVRSVGDALEKWYRQQQKVNEPTNENNGAPPPGQDDLDMADAEFEHLDSEEIDRGAQALDTSNADQHQMVDENMGIDLPDTSQPQSQEQTNIEAIAEPNDDTDMEEDQANDTTWKDGEDLQHDPSSFIGKKASATQSRSDTDTDIEMRNEPNPELTDYLDSMKLSFADAEVNSTTLSSMERWQKHVSRTHESSLLLTSHLRLILEPTTASRLRGDFRTGKRLNMKRIIPYIASQYKRDKIWLRRALPSKRDYQILLAIDDSKSMIENSARGRSDGDARSMAFDTLVLISRSLSMLEVGEVGIVAFAEEVRQLHALDKTWSHDAGARVLAGLRFQGQKTDVKRMVEYSLETLKEARSRNGGSSGDELWQVVLAVGDGICEDHESIRRLLMRAQEERVMFVFIIIDAAAQQDAAQDHKDAHSAPKSSIMDLESVSFVPVDGDKSDGGAGDMRIERKKYMDSFPFPFYLVVRDTKELPSILATALRQWFAEVAGTV